MSCRMSFSLTMNKYTQDTRATERTHTLWFNTSYFASLLSNSFKVHLKHKVDILPADP